MIRVLIVDDSAVVRKSLTEELSKHRGIEVVGSAMDPYAARDKIVELEPDVLTLDLEMPRMDGLSFLAKLMKHRPMPVVVVSSVAQRNSEAALRALALGAVDIVPKPSSQYSIPDVGRELVRALRAAVTAKLPGAPVAASGEEVAFAALETTDKVIAIGSSTGGTVAIEEILRRFPGGSPGVVIAQHMPPGFTESFAAHLDSVCKLEVRQARDGDRVVPGVVLIAPGDEHMLLRRSGAHYVVRVKHGPPVHHQRPSVDVLFRSIAQCAAPNTVGVILTGMGEDGAAGLKEMRDAGSRTIAQDEASCVVFGMPRAAIELGAAEVVASLRRIPDAISAALEQNTTPSAI
ncbi:MAG: chemotaxis response regulator protein-glutamate methylesterase [Planctomycetes bacterium]|nr:chemotaxis response regulator protein-glutamate methylesterase [Planctomycetota bacterium]